MTVPAPRDPMLLLTPPYHQFSLMQVHLMLGWVLRGISIRGVCKALAWMKEMEVDWGFEISVPHFTTVRAWLQRFGLYKLLRPKQRAKDWVWIVDHSNQIGQEKCLAILAVRASKLPRPGKRFPLRLAQMHALELEPVVVSDKKVVCQQLEASVAKTGVPRAIISDHGGDLAGGIELFREQHSETLDIYDITHKAACLLKARLERDEQWNCFAAQTGRTKANIQQTEWAFLLPPHQRLKARYMNLGELIRWAIKTLAILDNPGPAVLQYGTVERLEEKLGWLRQFRAALVRWRQMHQAIEVSVDFVRTQGVYLGASGDLRKRLRALSLGEAARQLAADLVGFVAQQTSRLRAGERLPASSEVLESFFGKYKTLEREHSKGGFTGLLLASAACVSKQTATAVREALGKCKTKDVLDWVRTKLGKTVGSKRRAAYRPYAAMFAPPKGAKSERKPRGSPALAIT